MPRDYKPRSKARAAKHVKRLPGWIMLTLGLVIGLLLAYGLRMVNFKAPASSEAPAPSGADAPYPPRNQPPTSDKASGEQPRPRFEFYSILPELEVVIPKSEIQTTAKIEPRAAIEPKPPAPSPPKPPQPTSQAPKSKVNRGAYFLQAGSFKSMEDADRMKANLALLGLEVVIQTVSVNRVRWHRVRVGPYTRGRALDQARSRLRQNKIDFVVLKTKG